MVSPFRVIREELPRFLNEPHAAEFKEVMGSLIPQTPSEVAMEVAFAPISKPARLASIAASALTYSPEAEGAPLSKIAKWMDEAIAYARNRRRYAQGGLAQRLEGMGFTPEDVSFALQRFNEEREYFLPKGATNYESRPEMYLTRAPDKIVPREDWPYGESVGGTHNFLEGVRVPNRSYRYLLPEVLAHEAVHAKVGALPKEDIESKGRQAAERGALAQLLELIKNKRPGDYPYGITGQEKIDELAPQLVAAEGYLPAGLSLIRSTLGKQVLQTPEEKLWYMSRRYPRRTDIDAMTGASPD